MKQTMTAPDALPEEIEAAVANACWIAAVIPEQEYREAIGDALDNLRAAIRRAILRARVEQAEKMYDIFIDAPAEEEEGPLGDERDRLRREAGKETG